jgi:hypothetical protein
MGDVIPQLNAERAERDLGVEINLHSALGFQTDAWLLLGHIGGGRYPDLSDPIEQAEIIVLQTRPLFSGGGNEAAIDTDRANCGRYISTDPKPPQLLDAIDTEIWKLRDCLLTVLIATDIHDVSCPAARSGHRV